MSNLVIIQWRLSYPDGVREGYSLGPVGLALLGVGLYLIFKKKR